MTTDALPATAPSAPPQLKGGLGVGAIVFMVLAGAAPLTAVVAVVPLVLLVSGNPAGGVYFVAAAVILGLFSVGYTLMGKHVTAPGAMYSYISAGLGTTLGSGAAMLAIGAYVANLLAVLAYGGVLTAQTLEGFTGLSVPWWVCAAVLGALVALLGYLNVDVSAKVLGVVLVVETLIVLVLDVAIVISGGDAGLSAEPLNPMTALEGAPALGIMLAFLAFIGFEGTAIFRAEARDPERTIPRATYISVFGIGVFYAFTTWALTVGQGSDSVVARAAENPTTFVFELTARYMSPIMSDIMQVLLVTSVFACLLQLHNVVTRYGLAMSRRGILPAFVGKVHARHRAPSNGSAVLSIISGVALALMIVLNIDPIAEAYGTLSGVVGYGIIILAGLTCLAVIRYFRSAELRYRPWSMLVAPAAAFVSLVALGIVSFANIDLLTGDPVKSTIVVVYLVALVVVGITASLLRRGKAEEPVVVD